MAKSNSVIESTVAEDGRTITFTVLGEGSFVFDLERVHPLMIDRAALHGFVQRIADGAAMSRNPDTGQPATPADKMARMRRIAEHYMAGGVEWALRATGERKAGGDAGLVVTAMCRAFGVSVDEANRRIDRLAEKRGVERMAAIKVWGTVPEVVQAIADIKAANAKPDLGASLLAELDGE